jgi:hypothetical protein
MMKRAARAIPIASLLVTVIAVASPGSAQNPMIERIDNIDAIHADLSIGRLTNLPIAVTPCQQDLPVAASLHRPSRGVWAARFKIQPFGVGSWTLVVRSGDGRQQLERNVGSGATSADADWFTGPVYGDGVDILLRGPADRTAKCPVVLIAGELQEKSIGKPRGLVGPESRWKEASTELAQAPDSATLKRWGDGVVHLETLASATALIPCTGFYISPTLVLTAAHCIEGSGDITRTRLQLHDREIRGSDLTLLVRQRIDFAVVLVNGASATSFLPIGDRSADELVMWQTPRFAERLVSVDGCAFARLDGSRLQHKCDTSDGSSGSPLQVRSTGAVIGIQVAGCLDANGTPQCTNFALRIEEIRARLARLEPDLRKTNPTAADELFKVLRPGR